MNVVQEDLHNAIEVSKQNYYSQITYKLIHIQKIQKAIEVFKQNYYSQITCKLTHIQKNTNFIGHY